MAQVIVQKWEESERGWSTRPDGYSLHITEEQLKTFIKEYWDRMPNETPDEYSRPDGTPYTAEVNFETFKKVLESKNGVRDYGQPPGGGGKDGWIPTKKLSVR